MAAPVQARATDLRSRLLGGCLPPGHVYRLHPERDPRVPAAVPGADPGGVRLGRSGGVGVDVRRPGLAPCNIDGESEPSVGLMSNDDDFGVAAGAPTGSITTKAVPTLLGNPADFTQVMIMDLNNLPSQTATVYSACRVGELVRL